MNRGDVVLIDFHVLRDRRRNGGRQSSFKTTTITGG